MHTPSSRCLHLPKHFHLDLCQSIISDHNLSPFDSVGYPLSKSRFILEPYPPQDTTKQYVVHITTRSLREQTNAKSTGSLVPFLLATGNMLRRPATTITLTSADLETYEANRKRKLADKQQQQQGQHAQSDQPSNGMREQDRQAGNKARQLSQKDRIMGGQSRQGN